MTPNETNDQNISDSFQFVAPSHAVISACRKLRGEKNTSTEHLFEQIIYDHLKQTQHDPFQFDDLLSERFNGLTLENILKEEEQEKSRLNFWVKFLLYRATTQTTP